MKNMSLKYRASDSRIFSFLIILLIYILAFFAGFYTFKFLNSSGFHFLLSFFIADVSATILVWLSGIILKNSSVYDPYWSVAPFVIIFSWIILRNTGFVLTDVLLLAAVFFWGTRLTLNWAIKWQGMAHQDWRYSMLRKKSPKMWLLTNLVGINLVPTIVVYLALVPAYFTVIFNSPAMQSRVNTAYGFYSLNPVIISGFIICIASAVIQAVSDRQMDRFRKINKTGSSP